MGTPAGNLYAFDYSSSAKSTFLTPHFLISLFSEVLFSVTNRITCLLFNGVETLGEEKFPQMDRQFAFLQKCCMLEGKIPTNFYGQYDGVPERKKGDLLKNCLYI